MTKTRATPPAPQSTKEQIVEAALATLREAGFNGATSRAIAERGGFNQALIFYHYGTLENLLLAALDHTSAARLERYRAAIAEATSVEELARAAAAIYAEDRESGHMSVVAQMVAGSVARPELATAMLERMEPWIDLCEEAFGKAFAWVEVPEVVPRRELAYAFVTFYLGVNLLVHLDRDRSRTDALFERVEGLAPLLAALPVTSPGAGRPRPASAARPRRTRPR